MSFSPLLGITLESTTAFYPRTILSCYMSSMLVKKVKSYLLEIIICINILYLDTKTT